MSFQHDQFAHNSAQLLLTQLQSGKADWSPERLTEKTTYWHGIADWPRPDIAFEDRTTGASLAIEFKPPGKPKREYITGLGQAITYLRAFEFSAIILPSRADDGFSIAEYLKDSLGETFASNLPMGLFSYKIDPGDSSDLTPLLKIRPRSDKAPIIPRGVGRKVFWGYWRDLSQHDVFKILTTMDVGTGRIFNKAFERFWDKEVAERKALTWDGTLRKRRRKHNLANSYKSEKLNAFLSLRHIGVLSSDGDMTDEGLQLLHIGKIYGAASVAFMRFLGKLILTTGRHLDLIFWVEEQQRSIPKGAKNTALQFYHALDKRLQYTGIIPVAPKDKSKQTFLRDEQKLWNKLGILIPSHGTSYFHRGKGLLFNWRAIVSEVGE